MHVPIYGCGDTENKSAPAKISCSVLSSQEIQTPLKENIKPP